MYIYIINYIKKEKKAVSSPSLHRRVETFQEAQREDSPSRAPRGGNPIGMLGRRDAISLLLRAARVLVASETSGRLRRKAKSSRGTPRGERHPSLRCNSFRGVGVAGRVEGWGSVTVAAPRVTGIIQITGKGFVSIFVSGCSSSSSSSAPTPPPPLYFLLLFFEVFPSPLLLAPLSHPALLAPPKAYVISI